MIKMFTPHLPSDWKHVIGVVPIPPDPNRTWDEDIFAAEWCPDYLEEGWGWWIHLDGGKGLSIWQCSLTVPNKPDKNGNPRHPTEYLMRDFLDTIEEVQSWINRAVVVAQKAHEQDMERYVSPYSAKALVAFTTDFERLAFSPGTKVVVVEALPSAKNPEAFIVEVSIPDDTLVGEFRFDTAELKASDIERLE